MPLATNFVDNAPLSDVQFDQHSPWTLVAPDHPAGRIQRPETFGECGLNRAGCTAGAESTAAKVDQIN
jgi:hypothetical protein